ncbi:MAG: NPCBM/NEW2 domain-containing protein [Planctomycetaceae bacterium]|jgi:alpha-galactosidase|nr:NPCBM/NEW2 domain-containing protein [Planctomycetaceae bacterium]
MSDCLFNLVPFLVAILIASFMLCTLLCAGSNFRSKVRRNEYRNGFTPVELLMVIAIRLFFAVLFRGGRIVIILKPCNIRNLKMKKLVMCLFVFIFVSLVSVTVADNVALNRSIAEAYFVNASGTVKTPQIKIIQETVPFETKINRHVLDGPMRLGEKTYQHGIGINAPNHIRIVLNKPAERFLADIGIDRNADGADGGTCRFHVFTGEKERKILYDSELITKTNSPISINVPLHGIQEFDLVLDDGGDGRSWDQGDWADARVVFQDGTEMYLDEIGPVCGLNRLPFHFLYGGQSSAEILASWNKTLKTTELPNEHKIVHELTYTEPETQLKLTAVVTVYTDTAGIDWTLHFTNQGQTDSKIISDLNVLNIAIENRSPFTPMKLHRLIGCTSTSNDWLAIEEPISQNTIDTQPYRGRPSEGACPFFTVQTDHGGVVTGIGWTGRWKASFTRNITSVFIKTGMQKLHLSLKPGESIRTPRILQCYWHGNDVESGNNLFRQTMLTHILPKINGQTVVPPIAHLTDCYTISEDTATENDILQFIEALKKHKHGFEYIWHDAYYAPKHFPNVGDYTLPLKRCFDPVRFPNGFTEIDRKTHEAGLKFLQWYEPERASHGSILATEHPEWIVTSPHNSMGGLVDLGAPEAWKFVHDFFVTSIKEYHIDCLRIDCNHLNCNIFWNVQDEKNGSDRIGIAEIRYVEGLYALWDALLKEFPNLLIDNCASGGQRIDVETCSRSIPLWRTDATIGPLYKHDYNTAALYNQVISHGLNRYVPYSTSGQMGTSPYHFRSGFNGGIAFAGEIRSAEYPHEELKQAIAEGKRLRKYFSGNFYPVSAPGLSRDSWCVLQYHRTKEADGMVLVFRRDQSPYAAISHLKLREINPDAKYEVILSKSYTPGIPQQLTGHDFLKLKVDLDDLPDSLVIEYREIR